MGRPSLRRTLGVWANGKRVGRWTIPANGPMELVYDEKWIASNEGRPISLSLPINFDGQALKGEKVASFFDNLLPDNDAIRQRVRMRFGTPTTNAFDLLEAVGRDCAGALQLLPDDEVPHGFTQISCTRLNDREVEHLLLGTLSDTRLATDDEDDFRISIAGAQEKIALTRHEGRWSKPHGATPTTHILKLPLGLIGGRRMDTPDSLENEWLCGRILDAFGIPVAPSEVEQFGDTKALVVRRFDRELHPSKSYWLRLPQEDFCQATGTSAARKYQSDGGPGVADIARILQASEEREKDLGTFFRAQLLFWMLAATDGHAKNFSIRILPEGRYRLTPLYDVLSAWPITGPRHDQIHVKKLKLAMSIGKQYRLAQIDRRRLSALDVKMNAIIEEVASATPDAIDRVGATLPKGFPARLFDSITTGLRKAASALS